MKIYGNANVYYGEKFELLEKVSIVIDHGKIMEVSHKCYENSIDLHGDYVIPAFINGHCHLGDTGAKELGVGLTLEDAVVYPNGLKHKYLSKISFDELITTIRDGMKEMLKSGIAVAADFREGGVIGVEALRAAEKELPIHVLALGRPTLSNDSSNAAFESELKGILEIADGFGLGGINAVSEERRIFMRKTGKNKLFSVHIAEGQNDYDNSLKEYQSTEVERALVFEPDFMVHLTHTNDRDIDLMEKYNQKIICCPRTNLIIGDGFPRIDRFTQSNICWGLGTDNMMFTSPNMFREMDAASRSIRGFVQKPDCMDFAACLKGATLNGAKALQVDHEYGTIEVGKSASFLTFSTKCENLKYSNNVISSVVHRMEPGEINNFILDGTEVTVDGKFLFGEV